MLTLQQQVLQRLIVGYEGLTPGTGKDCLFDRFLKAGVGGVILFRENLQGLSAQQIAENNASLHQRLTLNGLPPWIAIDQEGGQVERLPHTVFPTGLAPVLLGLLPKAEGNPLAESFYNTMAQHLAQLGFTLNCVPTLDVNLNPKNPIIGVRAFGDTPETVWRLANIAMQAHQRHGLMPIGKHAPGHGNGTIDSHVTLPQLDFTEIEFATFRQAMAANIPALMVSHGFYPALQTQPDEQGQPATASRQVVTGLLREQCGYNGVLMTDDMCMGAIVERKNPVESAIASLKAGVDVLLYKQATAVEWAVVEGIVNALETGELDREAHERSLERIFTARKALPPYTADLQTLEQNFSTGQVEALADGFAQQALRAYIKSTQLSLPQLEGPGLLVLPDRATMIHYAPDQESSPEWPELFEEAGLEVLESVYYPVKRSDFSGPTQGSAPTSASPNWVVFVTFNLERFTAQQELAKRVAGHYPDIPWVIVSVGMPSLEASTVFGEAATIPQQTFYLPLGCYRPAMMRGLVEMLAKRLKLS